MEPVRPLEAAPPHQTSPLASARLARTLTVDEAAERAGLTPEEVTWLEEARVYRFRSTDDALLAALLYATGLGIDKREARRLAGLPTPSGPLRLDSTRRLLGLATIAALVLTLVAVFRPGASQTETQRGAQTPATLPRPWQIAVDVLNGSGDVVYTRRVASRIGALGYEIRRVRKADRFDYTETVVFYEEGGARIGERLARELGADARPLPAGTDARRLVVIVGPARIDG